MVRRIALLIAAALISGCSYVDSVVTTPLASSGQATSGSILFAHRPSIDAEAVYLTGDFAGWNPQAIRMADLEGNGTWTATQAFYPGEYHYRYVVQYDKWHSGGDNWGRNGTVETTPVATLRVAGVRGW
jgi:hypothetical protein